MKFFAYYSDGKSSKQHQVQVAFEREHLSIEGFSFSENWEYSALNKLEKTNSNFSLYKGEAFPYQSLSFDDPEAYINFSATAPQSKVLKDYHLKFEKSGTKGYLMAALAIVVILALFHFVIIPTTVKSIANNFPKDMEAKLGENYLAFANNYGFVDSTKTKMLQEFSEHIDFDTDYHLNFYVVESDMVNAFALPGGNIIVFSALIDSMTNYHQLVSLMGHETGHVELQHSLQRIFQEQSYNIFFTVLSGGSSEIMAGYIGAASTLNSLHNSREHEQQADDYALKILTKNNCDPKGAVELFEVFANLGDHGIPDFLSTHPSPQNRIDELNAQITALEQKEVIQRNDLQAIFDSLQTKVEEEPLQVETKENLQIDAEQDSVNYDQSSQENDTDTVSGN